MSSPASTGSNSTPNRLSKATSLAGTVPRAPASPSNSPQHREYAPGDDIKHIDWKVYARTERYHLKQYEQETNLVAWMVVDGSESMRVGTLPDHAGATAPSTASPRRWRCRWPTSSRSNPTAPDWC